MPKLASVATVDTASTVGNCFYAAAPLGLPPCPAGTRTVRAVVNTSVLIDGKYPVVEGDVVKLLETEDRPLTGPYQQPRIIIGSNIT